ncbi:uncharacterized protein At4g04775-like [Arachis ipaensis]|nr:uncharacterized protein At4g04775-like [Arachis ipaensis]
MNMEEHSSDSIRRSWKEKSIGASSNNSGNVGMARKKFTHPSCYCGAHAILFESTTSNNPNRLFFGCSYFKTPSTHCKYFKWLDELITESGYTVVEVQKTKVHGRLKELEDKVKEMEIKLYNGVHGRRYTRHNRCIIMAFFIVVVGGIFVTALQPNRM